MLKVEKAGDYMNQVTAAIIVRDGKVLLTRRGEGENMAGFWEFPGGKLEDGETLQECLERELMEELDIKTRVGGIFAENEYHYGKGAINLVAMHAEILEGAIRLSVHDRYEWVSSSDLMAFKLAPADVAIAEKVVKELI